MRLARVSVLLAEELDGWCGLCDDSKGPNAPELPYDNGRCGQFYGIKVKEYLP